MTYPYGRPPRRPGRHGRRAAAACRGAGRGGRGRSPAGPWDGFNAAAASMDRARELDAQRLAQDVADQIPDRRPPPDEVKLQRAMDRIEAGTYTPPQQPAPAARDAYGRYASACGPLDDATGTCGARYHAADCSAVVAGTAAAESARRGGGVERAPCAATRLTRACWASLSPPARSAAPTPGRICSGPPPPRTRACTSGCWRSSPTRRPPSPARSRPAGQIPPDGAPLHRPRPVGGCHERPA